MKISRVRPAPGSLFRWSLCAVVSVLLVNASSAQPTPPASGPAAEVKAMNTSRLLGGATVRRLDPLTGLLTPVSGMTAIIDDDASSGWTPPVGKTLLVISLADETTINSFTLFAPVATGVYVVSIASSLEAALDPQQRTELMRSDLATDTAQAVPGVLARVVVLELDIVESAPIRSVDVVGKPTGGGGVPYTVVVPDSSKDQNSGTADGKLVEVNFAANALGAKVAGGAEDFSPMIDGDTGTTQALAPRDGTPASASITLAAAVSVDRVSLAFEPASGTVTFLATDAETPNGRVIGEVSLDGTSKTLTLETAGVSAESITVVWTPSDGTSPLIVSEIGAFALARVERAVPSPDGTVPRVRVDMPTISPPPLPGPGINVPPPILPPSRPVSR